MKILDFYIDTVFYVSREILIKILKLMSCLFTEIKKINNFKSSLILILFFSYILFSNSVLAQTRSAPTDAGSLQQQLEFERPKKITLPRDPIAWSGVNVSPDSDDQTRVQVNEFKFKGNTLISNESLKEILHADKNRLLNFKQLQLAVEKVIKGYKDAGWVAFAYLPEQEISSGHISIEIVEVIMGELFINNNSKKHINDNYIRKSFSKNQAKGDFLKLNNLDRAILLLTDFQVFRSEAV